MREGYFKTDFVTSNLDETEPDSTSVVKTSAAVNNTMPDQDGQYSRTKRTVFSRRQLLALESCFLQQTFLSKDERKQLANELGLTERQVMVWFQNRRSACII